MAAHIETRYREYLYCSCCGATADPDDVQVETFAESHPVPPGMALGPTNGVCNSTYRSDPGIRWEEPWAQD